MWFTKINKDRHCLDTRFNGKFDAVAVDFLNNKELDKKFRKIKDEYRQNKTVGNQDNYGFI